MTNPLAKLGLTRDSAIWLWTKLLGLAGLVVAGAIDPARLGLSDGHAHVVMALCAALLYLGGQLSTSSLPGKLVPPVGVKHD